MTGRRVCRAKAARTRAQKQPRAGGLGDLHPMGEWQAMGCLVPGSITLGARQDRGHAQAQKQSPAGVGDCVQTAPMGKRWAMEVSGAGKHHTGHPPGQRACLGTKNSPRRRPGTAPMGEWQTIGGVWCRESTALGARRGRGHAWAQKTALRQGLGDLHPMGERRAMGHVWCQGAAVLGARQDRGHTRAQKQPPARAGDCAQTAPMGERRAMGGVWCREASHWTPTGAESTPGRKNSLRRGPEAVWMRDMGVTCPGRSV